MTPKEKALQLFNEVKLIHGISRKQCAYIHVARIERDELTFGRERREYWIQVKEEINKL